MTASTRTVRCRVTTAAQRFLPRNENRSNYYILNSHATLAVWIASGTSGGPHVATAGNNMGERIGPNGGNVYDNDDLDEVWFVSTAVNDAVMIHEAVQSGRLLRNSESKK